MTAKLERPVQFGRVLRELRVAAGLSQEALAERASMSVNGISALERGTNRAPHRDTLALLIQALQLDSEQAEALTRAAVRPAMPRLSGKRAQRNANLPNAATPLYGRQHDVEQIVEAVQSTGLISLTGPGGIGKTRLALEVGERVVAGFADGVHFVDLAPLRNADLLAPMVAAQFDINERSGEHIVETIARECRHKHALVILDNCEHVLLGVASIAQTLLQSCPDIRLLATSRQWLNVPGEHVYRVSALDMESAVRLFSERAKRAAASFSLTGENYDAVARIVGHLDRIALAIELAAARMNILTLDELEARLSRRFQVLTGGSRLLQPRQQTMRTAIDWSYNLLDEDERRLFRRLWVFSNGFSLDAALNVCADDEADEAIVFESLSCLVDKSLVVTDALEHQHRFRLLETIRAYAAEKVEERGETAEMHRRHARYFAQIAESADCGFTSAESTGAWNVSLEPDLENFRAALEWAGQPGRDATLAVELIVALQEFWVAEGFAKEISQRTRSLLDGHAQLSDSQRASLFLTLARTSQESFAHPAEMLDAARKALDLYERRAHGEPRGGLALALRQYGTALMRLGQFAEAETQLRRSVDIYKSMGDQRMLARCLVYLATLRQMRGDHAQARTALLDVLTMVSELGDDRMVPTTSMNVAETEFALGNREEAAARAKQNLTNEALLKSPEMRATQTANFAVYLFSLGKTREALEAALAAMELGSGSFVAVPLQHIAAIMAPLDPKRAARLLGYVDAVFRSAAFSRQFTENYTYDALMRTLRDSLDEETLNECMRQGAAMTDKHAMRLATMTD